MKIQERTGMRNLVILFYLALPGFLHLCFACGEGGRPPAEKIIGGRDAEEGEFPWQASLQRFLWMEFYHTCGASLVTSEWLVTAAHCITEHSVSKYRVMIGNNNLTSATPNQFHTIKMIVIKQGFDALTFENDIALLLLSRPVLSSLSPICLADKALAPDSSAVVTGWGATVDGGKASPYLQAVEIDIILRNKCYEYYGSALTDSMICAGYDSGGMDACQGDSGGPLLQWQNGRAYLVGITSWGVGCAEPFQPGVYTDVFKFVPWIMKYISPMDYQLS